MTIDEAIKHSEEVAEEKEAQAWEAQLQEEYKKIKSCKKCAEEHRQLAEWLKELKQLREQKPKSEWQQDHEILKAYSDGANNVLDKIRAEIEELAKPNEFGGRGNGKSVRYGLCKALEIIDKYAEEGKS